MIYTIIITLCRIGAIWGRTVVIRKTFQSIGTVIFMVMIIESNKTKKKKFRNHERHKNRKIHAQSGYSPEDY